MTTNEDASAQPPRRESSHKDLIVWRKAMDLANESMKLADMLPQEEKHILVREIVRTAVRIPTKIAQGHDLPPEDFFDTSTTRAERCGDSGRHSTLH
jgi:hypothetical protein